MIVQVGVTKEKGRGVFADHDFQNGDYICEYNGEFITKTEGLETKGVQRGARKLPLLFYS